MFTGISLALFTVVGVFVFPFLFPPTHLALSGSYTAGFNNRLAAVAAALASVLAMCWARRFESFQLPVEEQDRNPIDRSVLLICLAACAVFTAALGWILTNAQVAYNDNLYFLEYMDEVTIYHLHIYKDFPFLYGPMLLYFPVGIEAILRPFHVGVQGSYYAALTLMQLAGIVLLYITLEALPLSKAIKTVTLCLFTFSVLCPLLGLNYSLVRSLLPFSTLLFATRAKSPLRLAGLFALGEMLQLAVSPELGLAFAAGACFYACCQTLRRGPSFIPAIAAPILGIAALLAITGRAYLTSIAQFSSGCFNLVVQPLPYILIFLFAFVWLIPRMLGRVMKQGAPDAILLLSLFIVCIGLLPAAFGRCDPLHVFFNGAGVYLLAAVAVSSYSERSRNLWFIGVEVMLVWMQWVNLSLFLPTIVYAARTDLALYSYGPKITKPNVFEFERIIGRGKVSVPFLVPLPIELELKQAKQYQPDPLCFYIGVWDADAESGRVARMATTEWALIPVNSQLVTETAQSSNIVVGGGFNYPQRHQPYTFGSLIYKDLAENWTQVARSSNWMLYHNKRFERAGAA